MTIDQAEQTLIASQAAISSYRSLQMEALATIDRGQVATADGAKNLSDGPPEAPTLASTAREPWCEPCAEPRIDLSS